MVARRSTSTRWRKQRRTQSMPRRAESNTGSRVRSALARPIAATQGCVGSELLRGLARIGLYSPGVPRCSRVSLGGPPWPWSWALAKVPAVYNSTGTKFHFSLARAVLRLCLAAETASVQASAAVGIASSTLHNYNTHARTPLHPGPRSPGPPVPWGASAVRPPWVAPLGQVHPTGSR